MSDETPAPAAALPPDEAVKARRRQERGGLPRRLVVGALVVVFAILVPLTTITVWVHQTVLNTDTYVSTMDSIGSDPAVTAALSREITDELYTALDPQDRVAEALPPRAAFLAAPIADGAKGYVQNAVNTVLQSDQFQTIWSAANRSAHAQLVAVLRGHTKALTVTNDQVVLNLVPVLDAALQNVEGFASSVVGKPITIPAVSADEPPAAACARISTALGRSLPSTCGQIALFPAAKLKMAQRLVRAFDRGTIGLLILTPVIAAFALVLSRRRRRTLLQLAVGGMLTVVVFRRSTMWLEHTLTNTGKPENHDAREAILSHGLHGFYTATEWILIAGAVIVVVALVAGPYGWAVSLRRWSGNVGGNIVTLTRLGASGSAQEAPAEGGLVWVRAHFDVLRAAGVVVAILLVLAFNLGFWGVVLMLALVAVYEIWLHRLRPPETVTLPDPRSEATPPVGSGQPVPPATSGTSSTPQ